MSTYTTHFGPYHLEEMLGRGGMGEVYRAYDTEHCRTVAVKRLAPHLADDLEFQQRFRREARNVAQLSNPHIVPIHKYGEIDGHLYIDMRFVEGGDLGELVQTSGALPFDRAVKMLEQIASALDDAHRNGLVHRDVKPSNVLLDAKVIDFCYLADFGITKAVTTQRSRSLTRTGALLGSLSYMAPEQFAGAVTKQSDIYALTCVFFELITGNKPYEAEGLPALMHSHMSVPPPRPSTQRPGAELFDDVVATGMAKEAGARYRSAGDLARAARAALETHRSDATIALGSSAAPDEPAPNTAQPARPRPRPRPTPRAAARAVRGGVAADADDPASATPQNPLPSALAGTAATDDSAPTVPSASAPTGPQPELLHDDPFGHPGPTPGRRADRRDGPADDLERPEVRPERIPTSPRRLLPLAAVAMIVAVFVGIWAIGQGLGAQNGLETGAGPSVTPPAAASTSAVATGPVLSEAVFTGRTSDNSLTLAVGIKDGRAAGYLCDGKDVEAWLEGTISGNQLTLQGRTGETVVTANVDQRSLLGSITISAAVHPFAAEIAATEAGLYESRRTVEGITTRIGWIVLADGTQVGVRTQDGVRGPAPQLDPATLEATDNGQSVRAERLSGASTVILG